MTAGGLLLHRGRRTVLTTWAVLSAATVLAWLLAPESSSTTNLSRELATAVVALGLVKCRLIFHYFMEVRHAPRWLRLATDGWLAAVWLTLLGIYFI